MATAQKDDNDYPTIIGISCVDGVTPIRIKFAAGAMKIDTTTVISVVPSTNFPKTDANGMPVAKGTAHDNDNLVLPWYVNPSTGAVLVSQ